jgi:hypothetical protein
MATGKVYSIKRLREFWLLINAKSADARWQPANSVAWRARHFRNKSAPSLSWGAASQECQPDDVPV